MKISGSSTRKRRRIRINKGEEERDADELSSVPFELSHTKGEEDSMTQQLDEFNKWTTNRKEKVQANGTLAGSLTTAASATAISSSSTKEDGSSSSNNNNYYYNNNKKNHSPPHRRDKLPPQTTTKARRGRKGWQAGYYTSLKTQGLIQRAAGTAATKTNISPLARATAVLQTLLSTPPDRCNGANLVYALTLSAKLLLPTTTTVTTTARPSTTRSTSSATNQPERAINEKNARTFRALFFEIVQVLRDMVRLERKKKGGLTARQLCNAAWALAKHVDRDPSLLLLEQKVAMSPKSLTTITSPSPSGAADTNDSYEKERNNNCDPNLGGGVVVVVNDQVEYAVVRVVDSALDEIASALIRTLQTNSTLVKNGELCMAAWAYGVLRERPRPPGWKRRPRIGPVVLPKPAEEAMVDNDDEEEKHSFLRFVHNEEWDVSRPRNRLFGKLYVDNNDDDDDQEKEEQTQDDGDLVNDIEEEELEGSIPFPSPTMTDLLFDEIAMALNQPLAKESDNNASVTSALQVDCMTDGRDHQDGKNRSLPTPPQGKPLRIDGCQWSELANVAWAFATHGWACSPSSELLLMRIANVTTQRLQFDQLNNNNNNKRGRKRTTTASSRDIAQLIWSLGIAQSDNFRLADSLLLVVDTLRNDMYHHYRSLRREHDASDESTSLFLMEKQSPSFFASWSCADLVQVALSLAHARLDEGDILRSLYMESIRRLPLSSQGFRETGHGHDRHQFFFWEVTILLWAQARLHLTSEQGAVFEQFTEQAVSSVHAVVDSGTREKRTLKSIGLGSQEKANLVWSLVILEHYKSTAAIELLSHIFEEVSHECHVDGCIQLEHAHQLWQALFLLESESPQAVRGTPGWFREYLQSQWRHEKARPKLSSARHKALSQALTQMGVAHHNEHEEDIDVAIVLERNALWTHQTNIERTESGTSPIKTVRNSNKNRNDDDVDYIKVAVEFDGPNHFTRQCSTNASPNNSRSSSSSSTTTTSSRAPPRSLGHSILKYRLLKKQGWKVIRIPYYEFDKIPFWASMERQRYLQRLLKTHSRLKFSDVDISEYKPPVWDRKSRFD